MPTPALYCRVSTSEQAVEGLSLAHQEERGRAYCLAQGWPEPARYVEPGVSARFEDVARRPAFARLLADVAAGAVDTIVIADLKRWSRRLKVTIATLEELAARDCRLISLKEQLDYTSAVGRLTVHVLGSIAQMESDERSETAAAIHAYLKAQGKWRSGEPPFGAMLDAEGRLTLDPAKSPLLGRILALAAAESHQSVARHLTAGGIPPPGAGRNYRPGGNLEGRIWWPQTVRDIVQKGAWLATQPEPWPARWRAARDRPAAPPVGGGRAVRMLTGLMACPSGGRVQYGGRDSYYLRRGTPRDRLGTRCRAYRSRPARRRPHAGAARRARRPLRLRRAPAARPERAAAATGSKRAGLRGAGDGHLAARIARALRGITRASSKELDPIATRCREGAGARGLPRCSALVHLQGRGGVAGRNPARKHTPFDSRAHTAMTPDHTGSTSRGGGGTVDMTREGGAPTPHPTAQPPPHHTPPTPPHRPAPAHANPTSAAPLYCRRCGHGPNARPLAIVGPGYLHLRDRNRSLVAIGGVVIIRCDRCGCQHRLVLDH